MGNTFLSFLWAFICEWALWYFLVGVVAAIAFIIIQSHCEGWGVLRYLENPESWKNVLWVLFLWPFWILLFILVGITDLPNILASFCEWIDIKFFKK